MQIYVHQNGQQLGPFTEAELQAKLAAGTVSRQDLIWWEGQAGWVPLDQTQFAVNVAVPPPVAAPSTVPVSSMAALTPIPGGARAAAVTDRTSGLAIGALVSGILGLLCGIAAIVAIILGHVGLSEIKKNPGMKGRGMALAGLILGYAYVVIIVGIILFMTILGNKVGMQQQVKDAFKTINAQIEKAQEEATNAPTADSSNTNSAPNSATNAAPQTNNP